MNRIVLIGNGFDLAHGLPTRYEDFINDYWKKFIHNTITINKKEYKKEGAIIKTDYFSSLRGFSDIVKRDNPTSFSDIIKLSDQVKNDHNINLEITFENKILKNISENTFLNWVDIEDEYYKFLTFKFHTIKFERYEYYDIDSLNKDFDLIKEKLVEYLRELQEKTEIQISSKIKDIIYSQYNPEELTEDEYRRMFEIELKKTKEFANSLKELDFSDRPQFLHDNDDKKALKDIVNGLLRSKEYTNKLNLIPNDYMFLNFNYTSTCNLYVDLLKKIIPLIVSIHGELNNPNNSIIFGYGDEIEENYSKLENLNDNAYLENIKSIKYQETDNYKKMLNFINSDKYQVIILGHSCGNSDRTLLNTLFEHKNCVSIKPYYYQYKDEKTGETKDNYSDIVRNISRSFKDKKSMRDKVVNKTYTDWFSSDGKE